MSSDYGYERAYVPVGELDTDSRAEFISRTYNHLMGAIVAFTLIEFWLFSTGAAESIAAFMLQGSWLIVLGGFVVVSWIASRVAATSESMASQYMALGGFVGGGHGTVPVCSACAKPPGQLWAPSTAMCRFHRLQR